MQMGNGSACEIQAASEVYSGNRFEIYSERARLISFGEEASQKLRFEGHYDICKKPTDSKRKFSPRPSSQKATVTGICIFNI